MTGQVFQTEEAVEAVANIPQIEGIEAFGQAGDPASHFGSSGSRLDGIGHLPDNVAAVPKCCAVRGCPKRSNFWCSKCRVYLCIKKGQNCFAKYHSDEKL